MELKGDIVKINEISQSEIEEMYILMTEFYNDVEKDVFLKDLIFFSCISSDEFS